MRLPGYAFYNNVAIGDFLVQVLDSCGKQLLIEKEDCNGKRKPDYFVDTGVYTKNRHFRIVYSCKGGKNAVLMPTNRYALATREGHHPSPAEIFLKTIVTKVESGVTLLSIRPLASMVNSKVKSASRRTVEDGPTESLKLDRNEVMPETSAVKSTLNLFFFCPSCFCYCDRSILHTTFYILHGFTLQSYARLLIKQSRTSRK